MMLRLTLVAHTWFVRVNVDVLFAMQGTKISSMSATEMLEAKQLGYSDIQISHRTGATENEVRTYARDRFILKIAV